MDEHGRAHLKSLIRSRREDCEVQLSGGEISTFYYDLRPLGLRQPNATFLGALLWSEVRCWSPDAVAGPAIGGIPLAIQTAMFGDIGALMVRGAAKEHGLGKIVEGEVIPGMRTVIVDDVVTSGKSLLAAVDALHSVGAQVLGCAVILDRGVRWPISAPPLRVLMTLRELD